MPQLNAFFALRAYGFPNTFPVDIRDTERRSPSPRNRPLTIKQLANRSSARRAAR